ncbi:MAG: hypothetical protein J7K82_08410 [Thermoproteales archaeon]|nr:hypothetical protein [Thermoproteales archaeon]
MKKLLKKSPYFLINFLSSLDSGSIKLNVDGEDVLKTTFYKGNMLVNLENVKPLKGLKILLKLPTEEKSLLSQFSKIKDLAEYIKKKNLTISLSWKNKNLIVIGNKAKPKMLKLVLRTDAIEIKSMKDLILLINELR